MTFYDNQHHKGSGNLSQQSDDTSKRTTVAKVTVCPSSPNHKICTIYYVDVTGKYEVACLCSCHKDKHKKIGAQPKNRFQESDINRLVRVGATKGVNS